MRTLVSGNRAHKTMTALKEALAVAVHEPGRTIRVLSPHGYRAPTMATFLTLARRMWPEKVLDVCHREHKVTFTNDASVQFIEWEKEAEQ